MTTASDWTPVPGLLELLEQDADIEVMRNAPSLPTVRSGAGDMLDSLVSWIRGFRRDKLICERHLDWVTVAELWPAPDGEATLKYKSSKSRETNAQLTVLASTGFGSAGTLNISQSLEIPTKGPGRRFSVGVYLTIWRYINKKSGESFDRVDVACGDAKFQWNAEDLSPDQFPAGQRTLTRDELRKGGFEVRGEFNASGSASGGLDTYGESVQSERQWGFEMTLPGLDLVQSKITLGLKTTRSECFDVSFRLPRGHDYVFFQRIGEDPLVPLCARLERNGR